MSAANLAELIHGSEINRSHENCGRVQDAYSMRCAPQVHGACRDALAFVRRTVETEANAATDNPMVFTEGRDIVSGGNFHGAPVALAADLLAMALAPLATISERRVDRLLDPALSGLPAFLTLEGGLRSGLMLAHVTAAACASDAKALAHPSGVDSIPLKAEQALSRVREVVAIELLCACQAIDMLAPLRTSPALARVHALVRSRVPSLDDDRAPAPDIAAILSLIVATELENVCGDVVK